MDIFGLIFCSVLLVFSVFILYGSFRDKVIIPIKKSVKTWPAVPCKITASRFESEDTAEGPTFWVNLQYVYQYEGCEYVSTKYSLNYESSSHKKIHTSVLEYYPVNKESVCYVNPQCPSEAVLYKEQKEIVFGICRAVILLIIMLGLILFFALHILSPFWN